MRLLRMPARLILLWTILYGVVMWPLMELFLRQPHPDCREWCGVERQVAFILMTVATLIWLTASVITWWLWKRAAR